MTAEIVGRITALGRALVRTLFGEYSAYYIYWRMAASRCREGPTTARELRVSAVDGSAIEASADPKIREQAGYAGQGCYAFACFDEDRIVGVCFYWFGDRYRTRNFWPLANREAKLVQIVTSPEMRGRGVATMLIEESFQHLAQRGFSGAYARIWHSNTPSLRAFARAGWTRIALVVEINPLRRRQPIRIKLPFRS